MNFIKALGTVAFFTMAVTGCSTSNEYLDLSNPVRVVAEESNGPTVCVSDVTDSRVFIGDGSREDTPSGSVLSEEYTSKAYARLKTAIGEPAGGLLLPNDKTVASVVKETIEKALADSGYSVVENAAAEDQGVINVAISVKKFWAWPEKGNLNTSIKSAIELDVYMQDGATQRHLNLKNTQTRKALTATKAQYKKVTEDSLSNIYYLATQKFKALPKN